MGAMSEEHIKLAEKQRQEKIRLIIDDCNGIYIPKYFCDGARMHEWIDISDDDLRECWTTCEVGPDADYYWESWQVIVDNARHKDPQGIVWSLHQDGDLFMVHDDFDWDLDEAAR